MKSSSSQKKRKSDVHLDTTTPHPPKKERPWYAEQASSDNKLSTEKDRRKSIIGLGKGLLKRMRSSSALKDRNNRDVTVALMSASTSTIPTLKQSQLNITVDPMPEDRSTGSELSSVQSKEGSALPSSFHCYKDLVGLVAHESTDNKSSQEQDNSFTSELCSSEDVSHLGNAASLCTPSRKFGRGKFRGSARSMPPESDLMRGLCNSAVRRTFSSASDCLADSQRFTRVRSIRLREKLALSASMAELPEEEVAPITSFVEVTDGTKTPVNTDEGSSRRTSVLWSTLRSKSRIFGSKKRADGTPLSSNAMEISASEQNITPSSRTLRRMSTSSASIQKMVSSVLKKGLGLRDSNTNLAVDQENCTPARILKRSSTNSKERYRISANIARRYSDVSGIAASELERQVHVDQKKKDAEDAQMYMEKVLISKEPIMQVLDRDGYDGVVVDVSATALPVSSIAREILVANFGTDLRKMGLFSLYRNGILKTLPGKPDIIYIVSEKDEPADKRVRVGVVDGMTEAFGSKRLKKIIAYPFCISHEEEFTDYIIQQFLLASYKGFIWSQKERTFDGTITLAGVTEENCAQMHRLYEEFLESEVKTKIAAYENLCLPSTEKTRTQDLEEKS